MKPPASLAPSAAVRPGYCRWVVCGLLFFATTINYIDRQVIGILKPTLMKAFQWQDERIYAAIIFSFQFAYAIGLVVAGRVMDRIGIRRGFALAVVLWSFAAVAPCGCRLVSGVAVADTESRWDDGLFGGDAGQRSGWFRAGALCARNR
jgi:ACS family hexuronate transporter-like MFS transporter